MKGPQWDELQRLYHAAADLPPAERAAYLDQACASDAPLRQEIDSLLASETSSPDPLDQPAVLEAARAIAADGVEDDDALEPGALVGPYRIVAAIGRGGMGVVYRAEQQEPVRRLVALKVTRPGLAGRSALARFQAERQALALMDHPAIARVFDAGATAAGLPYFAMELVEGPPVTEYAARAGLDLRARLALFIPVCQAIQHAHQKGIIHRDIKPANVLVATYDGQPAPKVIDFGIAKVLEPVDGAAGLTRQGWMMGTPDYMSPEQVAGDVDTRSDIYALGALLYELLTGVTPLALAGVENDTLEVLRRIREAEPPPPSDRLGASPLARQVRGELDWIVMKALEKDRTRRYAAASDLITDLEDYLRGAPVSAGPPSTFYRVRKAARRYRWPLAAAAGFLVLVTGTAAYSARQAFLARRAEHTSAAVATFLRDDLLAQASATVQSFGGARPDPDLKVRTALDRAASRVEARFSGEPLVEAALRQTLASAYFDLGLYPAARRQAARAVELRRRELGALDAETLAAEHLLLNVDLGLGPPAEGVARAKQLYESRRRLLGPRHPDTLATQETQAAVERAFKRNAAALALLKEVAAQRRQVLGATHPDTLKTMSSVGLTHLYQDQFAEAKEILSQVLAARQRTLGEEHPFTMESRNALALALMNNRQPGEAVKLLTEVLAWRRRVLGPGHRDTLATLNSLGLASARLGQAADAERAFLDCLAQGAAGLGAHHPAVEACRRNLANTYHDEGKYQDAAREYEAIVARDVETLGAESADTLRDMSNLGGILARAGRYAEGKAMLERTIALRTKVLGPKDAKTLSSMNLLAEIHIAARRFDDARVWLEKVAALRREVLGPKNPRTRATVTALASVLLEQGRYAAAEPLLREALASAGDDRWSHGLSSSLLGWSLAGQGRSKEAAPLLRDGHQELSAAASGRPAEERAEVGKALARLALAR